MASHAGNNPPSQAQSGPPPTPGGSSGGTTIVGGAGGGGGSSWTEPPWSGWIETTGDALIILEAARRGLIPRVTRRLVDSERKMITSGSVFVFDEDESGIKRWTDGFFWSPSRILGNFLLYRETDKRGAGHRGARNESHETASNSLLVNEHSQFGEGNKDQQSLSRPKGELSSLGIDKHRERTLVGSLTNSYKFKPEGMMKKTFSLTIGGVSQHLISYYKIEDVEQGRLRTPSSLPELASLDISPEYLDKTHFRNPPKVDYDIDGVPRYRGEADEAEPSPRATITAPMSTGQPLLLDSRGDPDHDVISGKRSKRYDPYSTGSKRQRKGKTSTQAGGTDAQGTIPQSPVSSMPPQPGMYPGNEAQHPHFAPYSVNYYQPPHQYGLPPHVYGPPHTGPQYPSPLPTSSPTSGAPGNAIGTSSPSPGAQATGVVSPAPGNPQMAYQGYGAPVPGVADAAAQNTGVPPHAQPSTPTYTYYPPPPAHYTPSPYGGMAWPQYGYPPAHGMAAPSGAGAPGGVGKTEEDDGHSHAQAQQAVGAEES